MVTLPRTPSCFHILIAALILACLSVSPVAALEPHREINGQFRDVRDVTIKCLECHRQQADQVLESSHWNWKRQRNINGKVTRFGKKDSLTGFGIDVGSNPDRCMGCHISTPPHDINFDNAGPDTVDCLVCHDTTGTYRLTKTPSNQTAEKIDLQFLARNVGIPTVENCTTCHFADCGLTQADRSSSPDQSDIHMSSSSFKCQSCHLNNSGHSLTRSIVRPTGTAGSSPESCISCHSNSPHIISVLNNHTRSVSCQACHIPVYAGDKPALVSWNWLMAGKSDGTFQDGSGRRLQVLDQNGIRTAGSVEPVYLWDDGSDTVYTRGQRIQPDKLTVLQKPGNRTSQSRIAPFRVIYSTQLYDTKYRYLVSPLLNPQGSGLFPAAGWDVIARDGMKAIILPYSGQHGFIPTVSYKRINHGVAPAEEALDCLKCHGSSGRMQWKMLGYDQDPMTNQQTGTENGNPLGQRLPTQRPAPPVQETFIQNDSAY